MFRSSLRLSEYGIIIFLDYDTVAILPYDHRLRYLPSYLQQADMESNGKSVDRTGNKTVYHTGPVIWGEAGTNGQHAFYQHIHQGTRVVPCDFIGIANPSHNYMDHHQTLLANFFAQTEALLKGKNDVRVNKELRDMNMPDDRKHLLTPYKCFSGNRPSTSILLNELSPFNLGALIAFYEHKILVQGVIWNIFSYDQWGVELGKQLAGPILKEIEKEIEGTHDPSTLGLMRKCYYMRK